MSGFRPRGSEALWEPLFRAAKESDPGHLFTYEELTEIVGQDVRTHGRYPVEAARRRLEIGESRTLVAVPRIGYRVSRAVEHAGLALWHQRRSRRQIGKAIRKATSADRGQLATDERARLTALELHLQRQAEFLQLTAERVRRVEDVQAEHMTRTEDQERRIRLLEEQLKRYQGG